MPRRAVNPQRWDEKHHLIQWKFQMDKDALSVEKNIFWLVYIFFFLTSIPINTNRQAVHQTPSSFSSELYPFEEAPQRADFCMK